MKKILLFVFIFSFSFANLVFADFKDIKPDNIYYNSITKLAELGIITGYPDGNFYPNKRVNRAEFTKMVMKTLQSDPRYSDSFPSDDVMTTNIPKGGCFIDVRSTDWYAKYVCFAALKNMIDGYPDGTFLPAQSINVVEAMKIVFEAVDPIGVEARADNGVWFNKYTNYADDFNLWVAAWRNESEAYQITRGELAEFLEKSILLLT